MQSIAHKRAHRGHGRLIAVSLIRGVAGPGLNSSLGIFFPVVSAFLGVGVGALSWSVSIGALAGMLFLPLAPRLLDVLGLRFTALIGILSVALSFFALGFAPRLFWWYLLAVPFGMGTVLIVNLLGPLVLEHEGGSLGASLGWMMTLAGLVAIPVQPLLTSAIALGGSRSGYIIGGVFALAVMLPCVLALPCTKTDRRVQEATEEGMARLPFLLLYLLLFIIVACNAFHQHIATLGGERGLSVAALSLSLSLSMGGAAVGGILLGYVTHRCGGATGGYLTLVLAVGAVLLFLFGGDRTVRFSLACFLHGVSSAAIGITTQTLAREQCGSGYRRTLSRLLTAVPLATVVVTPLWGGIYDHTGSYTPALQLLLVLLAGGVLCLAAFSLCRKRALS